MKEPKYSYYLKSTQGESKPVILKFNFGYKEVNPLNGKSKYVAMRYSTQVKVKESEWDSINQKPINQKDFARVEEIKDTAMNTFQYLLKQGINITPDLLKVELDDLLGRKKKEKGVLGICNYIEERIIEPKKLNSRTISQYTVLVGKLQAYELSYHLVLTTDNLDRNHYLEFQEQCQRELGKNNAVWGVMKNFKSVLNKMRRDYKDIKIFNPTDELSRVEKVQMVYDQKVYFDFNQIKTIIEYEPETAKLKNTKLILLTLLFSGCRYSDVFKIKPDHVYDDGKIKFRYAHFISEKGEGKEIIVPILKPLEDAIEANDGNTAYPISDVKFNEYVKDLCELAEMDEEIRLVFTDSKGGKKFENKPLFKFVSSHIGRRSFVTNLINSIPITLLSKVTGHSFKDNEVIFKYNKITLLQNATLFVKELRRLSKDQERSEEFPIALV